MIESEQMTILSKFASKIRDDIKCEFGFFLPKGPNEIARLEQLNISDVHLKTVFLCYEDYLEDLRVVNTFFTRNPCNDGIGWMMRSRGSRNRRTDLNILFKPINKFQWREW